MRVKAKYESRNVECYAHDHWSHTRPSFPDCLHCLLYLVDRCFLVGQGVLKNPTNSPLKNKK